MHEIFTRKISSSSSSRACLLCVLGEWRGLGGQSRAACAPPTRLEHGRNHSQTISSKIGRRCRGGGVEGGRQSNRVPVRGGRLSIFEAGVSLVETV
jgi:hypothetical protein